MATGKKSRALFLNFFSINVLLKIQIAVYKERKISSIELSFDTIQNVTRKTAYMLQKQKGSTFIICHKLLQGEPLMPCTCDWFARRNKL